MQRVYNFTLNYLSYKDIESKHPALPIVTLQVEGLQSLHPFLNGDEGYEAPLKKGVTFLKPTQNGMVLLLSKDFLMTALESELLPSIQYQMYYPHYVYNVVRNWFDLYGEGEEFVEITMEYDL